MGPSRPLLLRNHFSVGSVSDRRPHIPQRWLVAVTPLLGHKVPPPTPRMRVQSPAPRAAWTVPPIPASEAVPAVPPVAARGRGRGAGSGPHPRAAGDLGGRGRASQSEPPLSGSAAEGGPARFGGQRPRLPAGRGPELSDLTFQDKPEMQIFAWNILSV